MSFINDFASSFKSSFKAAYAAKKAEGFSYQKGYEVGFKYGLKVRKWIKVMKASAFITVFTIPMMVWGVIKIPQYYFGDRKPIAKKMNIFFAWMGEKMNSFGWITNEARMRFVSNAQTYVHQKTGV